MLNNLFDNNREWVNEVTDKNPQFFENLSKGQSPEYLWIGCSDSRVPANQVIDLAPGEVFVHRNIANQVLHTDINSLSVIQYAVLCLKVKHVIVCGHYGCGGVQAALEFQTHGAPIDNWLEDLKDSVKSNEEELEKFVGEEKLNRMCEINVVDQVINVSKSKILQQAWDNGQKVIVHGIIYSLKEGLIKSLDLSVAGNDDLKKLEASINS